MDNYTPEIPLKRCTVCKDYFLATTEFFQSCKDGKYKLRGRCRKCDELSKPTTPVGVSKICTSCNLEYPATLDFFHAKKWGKYGLQSMCKNCDKAYRQTPEAKARRKELLKSPEYKEANKKHRQTLEYKQRIREQPIKPEAKEKYALKRREPESRERQRIATHKRLARKRELPDTLTLEDWNRALEYFKNKCAVCGQQKALSADHWIPLNNPECPGTIPLNIVPLCFGRNGCNNSKGNRDALGWLLSMFNKDRAMEIEKRISQFFERVKNGDLV